MSPDAIVPPSATAAPNASRSKGKGRRRALYVIAVIAIAVFISAIVTADVVLIYAVNTSVGVNQAGQWQFANGGNYVNAHTLALDTEVCVGGGACPGSTITATIAGIDDVNVELVDQIVFQTSVATTVQYHIISIGVINPAAVAPAGVVCAYMFVSNGAQTYSATTPVAGETGGCEATVPAAATVYPACENAALGGASTGTVSTGTYNLLSGAAVTNWAGVCYTANPTAATTNILDISFAIYTSAAVTATALNTVSISMSSP